MRVLKFGGKSLANGEPLRLSLRIIQDVVASDDTPPLVVVSARGKTTDRLLELAHLAEAGEPWRESYSRLLADQGEGTEGLSDRLTRLLEGIELLRECSAKTLDGVLSFGELFSAHHIARLLPHALPIDAGDLIVTDSSYGEASVELKESEEKTRSYFAHLPTGTLPIVTGFIARSEDGTRTTLGRNGSNYTAALLANFLDATQLDNYSNIDGIYSAHPGIVLSAHKIPELSYTEAAELSQLGAEILHYKTIDPLAAKQIPLRILDSFSPEGYRQEGTLVHLLPSSQQARAIAALSGKALIHFERHEMKGLPGFDARIFSVLRDEGISTGIISQGSTERGVGFVVAESEADHAVAALRCEFDRDIHRPTIEATKGLSVIALIGVSLSGFDHPYSALIRNGITPLLVNNAVTGDTLFLLVRDEEVPKALNVIHGEMFAHAKRIHVACIGHGTVGGAFLDRVTEEQAQILSDKAVDLRLFAIASSRQLLLDQEGIGTDWRERKAAAPASEDPIREIIRYAEENYLENVVVIDNTASPDIAARYCELAEQGYDLVSSNKIFNTGPYPDYLRLREILRDHRRTYRYETNVGAGLPLIDNLRLLHLSGDRITRIRGLFSGTLGYILSSLGDHTSYAEAIRSAARLGYSEPDPRQDLNGLDVARKLLILAREVGMSAEMSDIEVEDLVPETLRDCSAKHFMERLNEAQSYFESLSKTSQGEVLRYVGELTIGDGTDAARLSCGLRSLPADSALGSVSGADSCFEIYTESYGDLPFVIRGAGAGAEVTALGVFGDLLRIADRGELS